MTQERSISLYTLDKTEPKGLPFSKEETAVLRSGFKFTDQEGVERVALDYTMTSAFQTCPLMFLESYVRGIGLKRQKTSLAFGSLLHLGLATWYRTGDMARAAAIVDEQEEVVDEKDDLKHSKNCKALIKAYTERYTTERWEVLEVEMPIIFQFAPGLWHFVIPDMVVKENGRIFGVEHKHTKSIHINYYKQFKPNQQLDGQVAGIRAKFGMCDGIIVNPIEIQKGGSKDRKMGVMRPSPYFRFGPRDISSRVDEDIEWWRRDMVQVYTDIQRAMADGYFRANKAACHNYEGCGFRELHLQHGDEYYKGQHFGERIWNPMDRAEEMA